MEDKKSTKTEKVETSEIEQLKEELVQKEEMIADYIDHLKRLQAEFENYIKRVDKERKSLVDCASERLIVKLLLIIDDFERALKINDLPEDAKKGIEMIFKNLHKILDEESVKCIDCVGEKFDPYKHEVLLQVDSEQPEGVVLEELQKGYILNGKVIRYSKVKVSKGTGGQK